MTRIDADFKKIFIFNKKEINLKIRVHPRHQRLKN